MTVGPCLQFHEGEEGVLFRVPAGLCSGGASQKGPKDGGWVPRGGGWGRWNVESCPLTSGEAKGAGEGFNHQRPMVTSLTSVRLV